MRYAHTNIISKDWQALASFYEAVFACVPVPPARDQDKDWLAKGTGVPNAHLKGMHLRLPGHGDNGPTLEIYSYTSMEDKPSPLANRLGIGHLAFEVDNVAEVLEQVLAAGGSALGEIIEAEVEGVGMLTMIYATDPEGNILEIQNWNKG